IRPARDRHRGDQDPARGQAGHAGARPADPTAGAAFGDQPDAAAAGDAALGLADLHRLRRRSPGGARPVELTRTTMARVMAVDPGSRRVGVALSDPTGTIAQPHSAVAAEPSATLVERL